MISKLLAYMGLAVITLVVLSACTSDSPGAATQPDPTQVTEPTAAPTPTILPEEAPPNTPVPESTTTPTSTSLPEPTATPVPMPTPIPPPTPIPNTPPVITNPGNKSYDQGEISAFDIAVTDTEDTPTVTLTDLPPALSYISGQVSGIIDSDAIAKDYAVTISADDGVNPVVSATFIITVTPNDPPVIANLGDKSYEQGETITAFSITVTDTEDIPTVTLSGLPSSLSYSSGQVSGTIDSDASAEDYIVTISTDDGVNPVVSTTFTITVTPNTPPVIANPGDKSYYQGETISAFDITVTDAEDIPTVTLTGLRSRTLLRLRRGQRRGCFRRHYQGL